MSAAIEGPDPVLELRVALTTDDYERLSHFYREGLGLEPSQFWDEDQGRALVLGLGRATPLGAGTPCRLEGQFHGQRTPPNKAPSRPTANVTGRQRRSLYAR